MPRAGHNGALALGTVVGEELGGHMVHIGCADGNDDVAHLEVDFAIEPRLVDPELLQRNLATALDLRFVLSGLLFLNLYGTLRASVLKLYLRAE